MELKQMKIGGMTRSSFGGKASVGNFSPMSQAAFPHLRMAGTPSQKPRMGDTPEEWYYRAKQAVATYDSVLLRSQKIANKTERERIIEYFYQRGIDTHVGPDTDWPRYMRDIVALHLSEADSYTPTNYMIFNTRRQQNRVENLEAANKDFNAQVTAAERGYGVLPEPQVITKTQYVQGQTDYTIPIAIGGAVVLGVILIAALG